MMEGKALLLPGERRWDAMTRAIGRAVVPVDENDDAEQSTGGSNRKESDDAARAPLLVESMMDGGAPCCRVDYVRRDPLITYFTTSVLST
jgi:hypothetical protein